MAGDGDAQKKKKPQRNNGGGNGNNNGGGNQGNGGGGGGGSAYQKRYNIIDCVHGLRQEAETQQIVQALTPVLSSFMPTQHGNTVAMPMTRAMPMMGLPASSLGYTHNPGSMIGSHVQAPNMDEEIKKRLVKLEHHMNPTSQDDDTDDVSKRFANFEKQILEKFAPKVEKEDTEKAAMMKKIEMMEERERDRDRKLSEDLKKREEEAKEALMQQRFEEELERRFQARNDAETKEALLQQRFEEELEKRFQAHLHSSSVARPDRAVQQGGLQASEEESKLHSKCKAKLEEMERLQLQINTLLAVSPSTGAPTPPGSTPNANPHTPAPRSRECSSSRRDLLATLQRASQQSTMELESLQVQAREASTTRRLRDASSSGPRVLSPSVCPVQHSRDVTHPNPSRPCVASPTTSLRSLPPLSAGPELKRYRSGSVTRSTSLGTLASAAIKREMTPADRGRSVASRLLSSSSTTNLASPVAPPPVEPRRLDFTSPCIRSGEVTVSSDLSSFHGVKFQPTGRKSRSSCPACYGHLLMKEVDGSTHRDFMSWLFPGKKWTQASPAGECKAPYYDYLAALHDAHWMKKTYMLQEVATRKGLSLPRGDSFATVDAFFVVFVQDASDGSDATLHELASRLVEFMGTKVQPH